MAKKSAHGKQIVELEKFFTGGDGLQVENRRVAIFDDGTVLYKDTSRFINGATYAGKWRKVTDARGKATKVHPGEIGIYTVSRLDDGYNYATPKIVWPAVS